MAKLGDRVRDSVTGFAGTVTSRTEYLGAEPWNEVTSEEKNHDGQFPAQSFPEGRLVLTQRGSASRKLRKK